MRRFAAFADAEGKDHISTNLFLKWKASYGSANQNTWSMRLGMVRCFRDVAPKFDPRTEVPPAGLITGKYRRARPFIFSKYKLRKSSKPPRIFLPPMARGLTCSTVLGLIAVTGLRINEALNLNEEEVDL